MASGVSFIAGGGGGAVDGISICVTMFGIDCWIFFLFLDSDISPLSSLDMYPDSITFLFDLYKYIFQHIISSLVLPKSSSCSLSQLMR